VLGTYKILGATVERTDRAIKSRSGGVGYIRQCVRFANFCNYSKPSQEVIKKLIALPNSLNDDALLIAALNEVDRYQKLNK